jgi:nucleoside-diphosphate-sugar epimerase
MQGVVYGVKIDEMEGDERLLTRFDFDACMGTAINRFCAQAVVGKPITPYGQGKQKRGFLPLKDSMQCLNLIINSPPGRGTYRVINQLENVYTLNDLAYLVAGQWDEILEANEGNVKGRVEVQSAIVSNIENPRNENEDHYYKVEHVKLAEMGYKPTTDMTIEVKKLLLTLEAYKERIHSRSHVLLPDIIWDGSRRIVKDAL